MNSYRPYLTDLTLTQSEFDSMLTAEIKAELSGLAHYTRRNGDIHWYTITGDLSSRVHAAYMAHKNICGYRALIAC